MLNKCLIAVKSKNEWKNNTFNNPLGGYLYLGSFKNDLIDFILNGNVSSKSWTQIPQDYILDNTARQNFIYYIKWA